MSDALPPAAPPPLPAPVDAQRLPTPPFDKPYYAAPPSAAVTRFWKKYATFTGRASRAEFWWWTLVWALVGVFLSLIAVGGGVLAEIVDVVRYAWLAATITPFASLAWRRLHDSNVNGWWALPYLAATVYLNLTTAFGWQIATAGDPRDLTSGTLVFNLVTGLAMLGFSIQFLVLVLRSPSPAGARFDS